jgi:hypothetical protein
MQVTSNKLTMGNYNRDQSIAYSQRFQREFSFLLYDPIDMSSGPPGIIINGEHQSVGLSAPILHGVK